MRTETGFDPWKWPNWLGWSSLIIIGLLDSVRLKSFSLDWQSVALILIGILLGFTPLGDLLSRIHKAKYKDFELILDVLNLPPRLRKELSGLSPHDIWALNDFADGTRVTLFVDKMKPAQRVAARMLVELELLTIEYDGTEKKVSLTPRGQELLEKAKTLQF